MLFIFLLCALLLFGRFKGVVMKQMMCVKREEDLPALSLSLSLSLRPGTTRQGFVSLLELLVQWHR